MQVIDILRYQQEVIPQPGFQIRQGTMRSVRRNVRRLQLTTAFIVKRLYQLWIALITFRRSNILHAMLFPQPVRRPEGTNTRLSRDPGAGQHHDKRLFQLGRRHGIAMKNPRTKALMQHMLTLAKLTQPMTSVH
ncbi:hypothetical protein D3C87_1819680 [compost metagenome]